MSSEPSTVVSQLGDRLIAWFRNDSDYLIALSGGVDSAVVACAARHAGVRIKAVTGTGPATSQQERADAHQLAKSLGLEHYWLQTAESQSADYRRNDLQRCFHCKTHLFAALQQKFPLATILTGTNADDLSDYRPGLQAAKAAKVLSPLAELGIAKNQVRQLARHWNLHVADKPASPCLASRIAYGVEVTPERLAQIEAAEQYLKGELNLPDCRVRLHPDELARIEVSPDYFPRLLSDSSFERVAGKLRELGFRHVTIDLAGLRSGSLNPPSTAVQIVKLELLSSKGGRVQT